MTHTKQLLNFFRAQESQQKLPGYLEISKGNIAGHVAKHVFGFAGSIGTSDETVWDNSGIYPYPVSASQLSVQSDSVADIYGSGIGAWMLVVFGLDADYNEIYEYIQLDGTNTVVTVNSYLRISQMVVAMAGTALTAQGTITATVGVDTVAQINPPNNITLMGLMTVPAGKTAYITHGQASVGNGKDAEGLFAIRQYNTQAGMPGVFVAAHIFKLFQNVYEYHFEPLIAMPEKTDLEVRAKTSQGTVAISIGFDIVLVDN